MNAIASRRQRGKQSGRQQAGTQGGAGADTGLLHLSGAGLLRARGPDAADFLERQLTARIADLSGNNARIACWCNPKGQSICTLWVQRLIDSSEPGFLLGLQHSLLPRVLQRLRLYVLRDRVDIQHDPEYCLAVPVECIGAPPTPCWQALIAARSSECRNDEKLEQAWREQEVRQGFVWLDHRTSERFLPRVLGMERWQAVDYGKGCFPGQEIIARTHYLGRAKKALCHLQLPSGQVRQPPETGEAVTDERGRMLGQIVAAARSDSGYELLAVLQMHDKQSDTVLCYKQNKHRLKLGLRHSFDA